MEELREVIDCYIEQLERIKREDLTVEQMVERLQDEGKCMTQEKVYLYTPLKEV